MQWVYGPQLLTRVPRGGANRVLQCRPSLSTSISSEDWNVPLALQRIVLTRSCGASLTHIHIRELYTTKCSSHVLCVSATSENYRLRDLTEYHRCRPSVNRVDRMSSMSTECHRGRPSVNSVNRMSSMSTECHWCRPCVTFVIRVSSM